MRTISPVVLSPADILSYSLLHLNSICWAGAAEPPPAKVHRCSALVVNPGQMETKHMAALHSELNYEFHCSADNLSLNVRLKKFLFPWRVSADNFGL